MMAFIRRAGVLCLALLLGSVSFGQATVKTAAAPRKLLFWKAVSGSHVVYLLGSIHVGSADMYPLPKVETDAFQRSHVLVEELNLATVNQADVLKFIQANGVYRDGTTLWDHLGKTDAAKVKKFFAKYNMPAEAVGMFKPWLASIMTSMGPMLKQGLKGDLGIDEHFSKLAKADKKPIVAAETLEFQMKMLSGMPTDLATAYLVYQVDQALSQDSEDSGVLRLWKSGDADALDMLINYTPVNFEPLMNRMLYDRNPHMADLAEHYLKTDGPCFFVVGAAHLVGRRGVVEILRQRGYEVDQLSAD